MSYPSFITTATSSFALCLRYNFASLIISAFIRRAGWFAYDIISLCLLYLFLSDVLSPWNGVPWAVRAVALSKMMNMTALVQAHRCHVYHFWHVSLPTLIISHSPALLQYKITLCKLLNIWLDFLYTKLIITLDLLIGIYVKMDL